MKRALTWVLMFLLVLNLSIFGLYFYREATHALESYEWQGPPIEGHWGKVTSSIDWCEKNYAVTIYIAEFWNTVSSFHFVLIALWTLWTYRTSELETRFKVGNLLLAFTGLGSMLFHGTLKRQTQLADELPMGYVILSFFYITVCHTKNHLKWVLALSLYAVAFTAAMLLSFNNFIFQLPVLIIVVYIICVHFKMFWTNDPLIDHTAWLLLVASFCFLFVGTMAWPLERLYCRQVHSLQLHSWWHIGTGCAVHLFFQAWVHMRLRARNIDGKLVFVGGLLPITVRAPKQK